MERNKKLNFIIENMEKVIVGKRDIIELALITMLTGGHLLLEDVPGVGKTTLGKALAQSIACSFARITFTPDTLPGDVTGMTIYHMQTGEFRYMPGAIMHDVLLADEINRTSPKTRASLLEAMEEGQVSLEGKTYPLSPVFMVIATQNPIEHLGTFALPEAQLDRFLMKVSMGYPQKTEEERELISRALSGQDIRELKPVITLEEMCQLKQEAAQVKVHPDLLKYAVALVRATRKSDLILLGASPRAAIALVKAARSRAYLMGRDYTIPEDLVQMTLPVLSHRLILSSKGELEGRSIKDILSALAYQVEVPVL